MSVALFGEIVRSGGKTVPKPAEKEGKRPSGGKTVPKPAEEEGKRPNGGKTTTKPAGGAGTHARGRGLPRSSGSGEVFSLRMWR